jgi:tetratricopeptide (TPR) repeat protein
MPTQPVMQRDARRDHSFSRPDPRLAGELGASDPCLGCHFEAGPAWAVREAERLFGDDLNAKARARARAAVAAQRGDPGAAAALADRFATEPAPAWRASIAGWLAPHVDEPAVRDALVRRLDDASPLVRTEAVRALGRSPGLRERLAELRADPSRMVRLYAAWATRTNPPIAGALRDEVLAWLAEGADQPAGALRLSELAVAEGRTDDALTWAERAVRFDASGPSFHTLARALHAAGRRDDAERALREAERLLSRAPR